MFACNACAPHTKAGLYPACHPASSKAATLLCTCAVQTWYTPPCTMSWHAVPCRVFSACQAPSGLSLKCGPKLPGQRPLEPCHSMSPH